MTQKTYTLEEIERMLEVILPWKFCTSSYDDDLEESKHRCIDDIYTISDDPERTGWETDGGSHNYGLSKPIAEAFSKSGEIISQLLDQLKEVEEALEKITSVCLSTNYHTIETDIQRVADEALTKLRGRG